MESWHVGVSDKRGGSKGHLVRILKNHGFKPLHLFSNTYVKGDIKAKVASEQEYNPGSKKHGTEPYHEMVAMVDIEGPNNAEYKEICKELGEYYDNPRKGVKRKSVSHKASLDEQVGVFLFAVIGILVGLFFLSTNITGNAIGSLNPNLSNGMGGVLFIVGLIGAFAYFKKK